VPSHLAVSAQPTDPEISAKPSRFRIFAVVCRFASTTLSAAQPDTRDPRRDVTQPPSRSARAPATGSLPRVMAEDAAEAAAQMEEKLKVEDDAAA
jgi:hypothetical protein